MHAQVLLRAAELPAPDGVEDLLVGEGAPAGGDERMQDLPLDRREVNLSAIAVDAARGGIDRQPLDRDGRRRPGRGARATQLRTRPGRELEHAERLGDVIVGAGVEE